MVVVVEFRLLTWFLFSRSKASSDKRTPGDGEMLRSSLKSGVKNRSGGGRIGKESGAGKMSVYGSGSGSGGSGGGADMAAKLIIGLLLM